MSDDSDHYDDGSAAGFQCPVCNKVRLQPFSNNYLVLMLCTFKVYSKIAHLKRHQKSHVEAKQHPFKCAVCERTFTRRDHYNFHLKSHNEERLACHLCRRPYKHAVSLKRHLRAIHSLDWNVGDPLESAMAVETLAIDLAASQTRSAGPPRSKRRKSVEPPASSRTNDPSRPSKISSSGHAERSKIKIEPPTSPLWQADVDIRTEKLARAPVRTTRSRSQRTRRGAGAPFHQLSQDKQPEPQVIYPQQRSQTVMQFQNSTTRSHPGTRPLASTPFQRVSLNDLSATGQQRPQSLPAPSMLQNLHAVPLHQSNDPSPLDILTQLPPHTRSGAGMLAPVAQTTSQLDRSPFDQPPFVSYPSTALDDQQSAVHSILQLLMQQQYSPASQAGQATSTQPRLALIDRRLDSLLEVPGATSYTATHQTSGAGMSYQNPTEMRSNTAMNMQLPSRLGLAAQQLVRLQARLAPPAMAQAQPMTGMQLLSRSHTSQTFNIPSPASIPPSPGGSMQLSSALSQPPDPSQWGQAHQGQGHPLVQLSERAFNDIDQSMTAAQQSLFDAVLEELAREDHEVLSPTTTTSAGFGTWPG